MSEWWDKESSGGGEESTIDDAMIFLCFGI